MEALVGHWVEPGAGLTVDIGQVFELAQGPEVLAEVGNAAAFDFAFLPGRSHMAGARVEVVVAGEGEKTRVETHQLAFMLGHGGKQIVIENLPCHAGHEAEGMLVAAQEGFKTLAVSELDVEAAAVALDQAKGVEFAAVAVVIERTEVAPVDLKAIAGRRLDAHVSAQGPVAAAQAAEISAQHRQASVVAQRLEPLPNDHGAGRRVSLQ